MATKTAENVAQVEVRGTLGGENVENVFYFLHDGAILPTDLDNLVADVAEAWIEGAVNRLPDNWTGKEVYAFDMTAGALTQALDTSIGSATGAGASPQPNNVTIAIARKTGNRGRSTNGRIFWMGLYAGVVTDNRVTEIFEEAVIADLATIATAVAADGWTPVTLSFQRDGVISTAAVVTPISEWVFTDNVLDSRRRRLPGRGS